MIIIAGTVDVDPAQRDAALEAGKPHMQAPRAPVGLIPGRIYVFERWESQDDLAAHFAGPHYLAMRDTIAVHGLRGADVLKYRIGHAEPVYDPSGKPRADFFTEPT